MVESSGGCDELGLSVQERGLLLLASSGATNQQIAVQAGVSARVIGRQLRQVRTKLGAVTNVQAVTVAIRRGDI